MGALRAAGARTPGHGVGGAGVVVIAICRAVTVTHFQGLHLVVAAGGAAIIVTVVVAPRRAAPVIGPALNHTLVHARRAAVGGAAHKCIHGALVVILTGAGAIPVTGLPYFQGAVAAGGAAVTVILGAASRRAASITALAGAHRLKSACSITIARVTIEGVHRARVAIIAHRGTIAVTRLT